MKTMAETGLENRGVAASVRSIFNRRAREWKTMTAMVPFFPRTTITLRRFSPKNSRIDPFKPPLLSCGHPLPALRGDGRGGAEVIGTACARSAGGLEVHRRAAGAVPVRAQKPTCANCPVHCYQRERARTGARHHAPRRAACCGNIPSWALRHWLDGLRENAPGVNPVGVAPATRLYRSATRRPERRRHPSVRRGLLTHWLCCHVPPGRWPGGTGGWSVPARRLAGVSVGETPTDAVGPQLAPGRSELRQPELSRDGSATLVLPLCLLDLAGRGALHWGN